MKSQVSEFGNAHVEVIAPLDRPGAKENVGRVYRDVETTTHSDEENLRWAWLRAVEWKHWPLFLSQPIVPVLLYFYPWPWVIGLLVIAAFAWWFTVAPQFTPSTGVDLAVYFVYLRFLASPLTAYWIWQSGRPLTAALALFWPFLGNLLVLRLLTFPEAVLASTARAQAAQIGVIQKRGVAPIWLCTRGSRARG